MTIFREKKCIYLIYSSIYPYKERERKALRKIHNNVCICISGICICCKYTPITSRKYSYVDSRSHFTNWCSTARSGERGEISPFLLSQLQSVSRARTAANIIQTGQIAVLSYRCFSWVACGQFCNLQLSRVFRVPIALNAIISCCAKWAGAYMATPSVWLCLVSI